MSVSPSGVQYTSFVESVKSPEFNQTAPKSRSTCFLTFSPVPVILVLRLFSLRTKINIGIIALRCTFFLILESANERTFTELKIHAHINNVQLLRESSYQRHKISQVFSLNTQGCHLPPISKFPDFSLIFP